MTDKKLSQHVEEMKRLSDQLVPYSFPNVDFEEECIIIPLKCRTVTVDGYDMSVSYSKSDYQKYMVESVQIQSNYTPFLPFNVVCKVARAYLGSEHLSYVDFMKNQKKIYCWTVRKKRDKAVPPSKKSRPGSYEGFDYRILHPGPSDLSDL